MLQAVAAKLSIDDLVSRMKAAGEPTRLRILALLADTELTVKDLTFVLGQSQPRISRHLKLMTEAGLIDRNPEGAWVYYRIADKDGSTGLVRDLINSIDHRDSVRERDQTRLAALKTDMADRAARYFAENAKEWDAIRTLHVPEEAVDAGIMDLVGDQQLDLLVDLGTGTGRILELLRAHYAKAIGIDTSSEMLAVARSRLNEIALSTAQVRRSDINQIELPSQSADLVTLHQVLHYLSDPDHAIREAARLLKPGGRLLIVDFAPHAIETLRTEHAHRRLGFSTEQITEWIAPVGLELSNQRALKSNFDEGEAPLTVMLWLATKRAA